MRTQSGRGLGVWGRAGVAAALVWALGVCGWSGSAALGRGPEGAAAALGTSGAAAAVVERVDLDRAVVIGASVSAGFLSSGKVKMPAHTLTEVAEADTPPTVSTGGGGGGGGEVHPADPAALVERRISMDLASVLRAIGRGERGPRQLADAGFFGSPNTIADRQIASALEARPSVVFAVDYLFWHAYGYRGEELRPGMFRLGLERLDRLVAAGVPVVVGDVPDMSHAVGGMLRAGQVPSAETQRELNAMLAAWAATRPGVKVVGLAELVRAARAGEAVRMGGHRYEPEEAKRLLQRDGLHATGVGLVALAQEALAVLERGGVVATGSWERDPAKVLAAVRPKPRAGARPRPEGQPRQGPGAAGEGSGGASQPTDAAEPAGPAGPAGPAVALEPATVPKR